MTTKPQLTRWALALALLGGFVANSGCRGVMAWSEPGTMQNQQNMASLFDPFPDNQMGPDTPELRPREFSRPWAEPRRAQYYSELTGRGR